MKDMIKKGETNENDMKIKSLLDHYNFSDEEKRKYPVISSILSHITQSRAQKEVEDVNNINLSSDIIEWIQTYEAVGGKRNIFIWKWVYNISIIITPSFINDDLKSSLYKTKFLLIMFVVLIDDIVDKHKNKLLLDQLLKIPYSDQSTEFNKLSESEIEYLKFTIKVWNFIIKNIRNYPQYKKYSDVIEFDLKQLMNSMEYSYLINNNIFLINSLEYKTYFSHNMQLMIDIMMDLCCYPKFEVDDINCIRRVSIYAQYMTRIGNWISTWEREIDENDFTSGVFSFAIDHRIISISELMEADKKALSEKIKKADIEKYFLKEWESNYHNIEKQGVNFKKIDVNHYLVYLKKVMFAHLSSIGYK